MRFITVPAYDDFLGNHKILIAVLPDSLKDHIQEEINDDFESLDEYIELVNVVDGGNMYKMAGALRYNNLPDYFDSASLLHQFAPDIDYITQSELPYTLASSFRAYDRTVTVPSETFYQNGLQLASHNAYGVVQRVILYTYGFAIELAAVFESQMNGNTFNFNSEDLGVSTIRWSFSRNQPNAYTGSFQYGLIRGYVNQSFLDAFNGKKADDAGTPDDDPYTGDGDSSDDGGGPGGGDSDNYTPDSEPNPIPPLPSLSAVNTGFITLYNPTTAQLRNLAEYMWGNLFDITTWKKVFADPMDAILGLSIVPVDVPSSGAQSVTVGNISTGISMTKASSQYVSIDCGTISIKEYWKAYLDYSPFTKLSVFLPFIGSQQIDVDLLQGTALGVVYHVDVLSGACIAFITSNGNVIAQFSGQCAVSIPITSRDFTQTLINLGNLVAKGGAAIASGGLSAPVSAAAIAGGVTAAANTASNVASSKPIIQKSGNISGGNGLLGVQKPYIIIEKPKQCAPKRQNQYTGYPSYVTRELSTLSGFTQVQDIHLDNISCTDSERNEIMALLRNGVIL